MIKIGLILLLAGLWGCAIFAITTYLYEFLNGDEYGAAKKTRKEGLTLFGIPAAIGAVILAFQLIL